MGQKSSKKDIFIEESRDKMNGGKNDGVQNGGNSLQQGKYEEFVLYEFF